MCGLAGLFDLQGTRAVDTRRLALMSARLQHRGPDGAGTWLSPGIGLAHRRLAIRDVDHGAQPMSSEDGAVTVVYNGELYGIAPTVAELERRGHRFRTQCDTEMIVHGWREWGRAALDRFAGMFALAVWDRQARTLTLARDRLGEKPLYYGVTPDGFLAFASELPALLAAFAEVPPLDPQAVEEYFAFGYVPEPRTIHQGLFKLPPGHLLSVRQRNGSIPQPEPYWDIPLGLPREPATPALELADRLRGAVRDRLVADVPLGAFLSGGVDSSAVTAFMALELGATPRTFSVGFDDARHDETRYAAMVADRYATDHTVLRAEADAEIMVERLSATYGEPFADASAVPTWLLCREARRHVTVALSGDGADEVFAGYRRHAFFRQEERVRSLLPDGFRSGVLGPLAAAWPRGDGLPRPLRAKATLESLAGDAMAGLFRGMTLLPPAERQALFSGDFRHALGGYGAVEVLRGHAARAAHTDPLTRALYVETKVLLSGGMLTKVDRASMAHGLEVRAPFLDHRLVEWAFTLPSHLKLAGGTGKAVLKWALEPYLPREVLYRPKQGFSPPLAGWLRGPLKARVLDTVAGPRLAQSGLFDPRGLLKLAEEHLTGQRDHARLLWSLVMFDAFLDRGEALGAPVRALPALAV